MSTTVIALLIVAVWIAIGLALSVIMGRRGHVGLGWGLLGAMLGPLAVAGALATTRHEAEEPAADIAPPTSAGGPVDVVVGVDGSVEAGRAVDRVVTLLGPQLGRLTLAIVVPYEDIPAHTAAAMAELERQARLCTLRNPGQELLHGPAARALSVFASRNGYDLLAVGTRGRGLSKAVLGSTASALAAGCPVPVLMVGDGDPARAEAAA